MQDTAKYLVHAYITAEGIVERSDVVGAVFGQTEGLLGDELDLRELQDASKVGRIDVEIDSQNGQSFGRITIATSLDQVETAILGAALETIDRVGPCRSTIEVRKIEDVRAAKRRKVVDRAKSLLGSAFDESMRSSRDLVEEVRESVRIEDITDYEGFPAGPNVDDSDAIIVVEGRADVLTLLQYGIKNAVAVEGTDVPETVAKLTESRTVTAFLDGDRGGELIRKELAQVGDIDYVAFAPEGRSVEDLKRHEVMTALREKVPYEHVEGSEREPNGDVTADPREHTSIGGEAERTSDSRDGKSKQRVSGPIVEAVADVAPDEPAIQPSPEDGSTEVTSDSSSDTPESTSDTPESIPDTPESIPDTPESIPDTPESIPDTPESIRDHTRVVIGENTGRVRLLDDDFHTISEGRAEEAFDLLVGSDSVPTAVVIDGELNQKLLDVAAQRGVNHVVSETTGTFVKRPTSVRIRTADQLLAPSEA